MHAAPRRITKRVGFESLAKHRVCCLMRPGRSMMFDFIRRCSAPRSIGALINLDVLDDEQPLTSASALGLAKWGEFDSHPPLFS
jgi:hypothetical protein